MQTGKHEARELEEGGWVGWVIRVISVWYVGLVLGRLFIRIISERHTGLALGAFISNFHIGSLALGRLLE